MLTSRWRPIERRRDDALESEEDEDHDAENEREPDDLPDEAEVFAVTRIEIHDRRDADRRQREIEEEANEDHGSGVAIGYAGE